LVRDPSEPALPAIGELLEIDELLEEIFELLELVCKSRVVEVKRLFAYLDKLLKANQMPTEPVQLANLLVRDGIVTHFQAEQFLQGKWRGFFLGGSYKVLEQLGSGGMGSVYLCEHIHVRRRVAVKVLSPALGEAPNFSLRFAREAQALAQLDHPNIVRAYDFRSDGPGEFIVMEHVDGSNLWEITKRTGAMDVVRAAHYIRQAALGLQYAHEAGLVHRDIKPGNILVDRNGVVKVLDMGLVRFFHTDAAAITKKDEQRRMGTPDYMAPEQALDSYAVDIRADIYSLGATFYFCLTGRTPFAEGTVAQKLTWHQTRAPKPIRSFRPEVPEGIVGVIDKMMAKDVAQRYQTPQEVADALAPWTQTPIPPPPESEMPQFSLAATRPLTEPATPSRPELVADRETQVMGLPAGEGSVVEPAGLGLVLFFFFSLLFFLLFFLFL
jgi:serine/threonine protein kinase